MRVVGDTIFAAGMLVLGWFVFGLKGGWSLERGLSTARTVSQTAP
jgi:nitric oxide reductase subunit B